jgi:hypothetical protein
MSGTARHRGSDGRFSRSEPPMVEDLEDLEDDQMEYGDENAPPRREGGVISPIPTLNTAQLELEERIIQARRADKRPVIRDAGEAPASPSLPELSTLSAGMDAQHQAQMAKVTRLKQQLLQQIEMANARAELAQLEEQLHSIPAPFRVREDTRETESFERVGEPDKEARRRLTGVLRRVADLQADDNRATSQSPGEQPSIRGSSRGAQVEGRKRHRSPSEDTSSEGTSRRRRHYGMKPKEPSVYAAKNLREHNEWLLDVENVFTIMRHEYRHDAAKVAYAQQWLGGDHRARWNRYLETSEEAVTFSEFCEVLLDMLQNPVLRTYTTVRRYFAAQQRKDQSVASFVAHLDTLEGQMLPFTDDQRRMALLVKLRPELQQAILQHAEAPPTRDGLITLATRLEDVKKMGTQHDLAGKAKAEAPKTESDKKKESSREGGPSTTRGGKAPYRGGRGRGAGGTPSTPRLTSPNTTAVGKRTDLSDVRCYNCGKTGHFANICRAPKAEKATGPS